MFSVVFWGHWRFIIASLMPERIFKNTLFLDMVQKPWGPGRLVCMSNLPLNLLTLPLSTLWWSHSDYDQFSWSHPGYLSLRIPFWLRGRTDWLFISIFTSLLYPTCFKKKLHFIFFMPILLPLFWLFCPSLKKIKSLLLMRAWVWLRACLT